MFGGSGEWGGEEPWNIEESEGKGGWRKRIW